MQKRENFYTLLELPIEPKEQDEEVIKNAINKKRSEWSKLRNHPTKAVKAKLYLGMIKEIENVMLKSEYSRNEEWKRAIKEKRQKEKIKYNILDEAIKLLCSKGYIFDIEKETLKKKFMEFNEAEINSRIKVPVKIYEKSKKGKNNDENVLDTTRINKIQSNLEIVDKKSLYDFLGVPMSSGLAILRLASKRKYEEIKKSSSKNAFITASSILQGMCDDVFKDEENKRKYDEALKKVNTESLAEVIEVSLSKGYIAYEEFDCMVRLLVENGMGTEEAKEYVKDFCIKRKVSIEIPKQLSVETMERCSICGCLNHKISRFCYKCGFPLKITCPKCHRVISAAHSVCTNCGFHVEDMSVAAALVRDAENKLQCDNTEEAYFLLKKAKELWQDNSNIDEMLKKIQNKINIIVDRQNKILEFVEKKAYYSGMKEIISLKKLNTSAFIDTYEKIISIKIAEAEKLMQQANDITNESVSIELCTKALNICSDCTDALTWLSKYPPKPPYNLRYEVLNDSVVLKWDSREADNVKYRVLRKLRSEPNSIDDGKLIGQTEENEITDFSVEAGQTYYYAVFSYRASIHSKAFSYIGPIMPVSEVDNIEVENSGTEIILSWSTPVKAKAVEVWRKEGVAPLRRGDGTKLENVSLFGVEDTELTSGKNYGYLIVTKYRDSSGKEILTKGITCFGKTINPPELISDIKLSITKEKDIKVVWKRKGYKGKVYIFYSTNPFKFEEGQIISKNKLSSFENRALIKKSGECEIKNVDAGTIFVLPVVSEGNSACVGKQQHISILNEVEKITGYIFDKKLYLQWRWPEGIGKVLVGLKFDGYCSGINDSKAVYREISRDEYNKKAAFIIENPEYKEYFFTVFAIYETLYTKKYSYGTRCKLGNLGVAELHYEIKRSKGIFGLNRGINFSIKNPDESGIPTYVLVVNEKKEPVGKEDGRIVYEGSEDRVFIDIENVDAFLRPFFTVSSDRYKFIRI
ncbi:ribosomal protein L32 [Clostridium acetobutylicum]|uniref:ACT domain containing transcriptional regulators, related to gcvR of E.coli n=1 Tax=Clostridium acetobutylicum (strain ATCC 824 / DSM 792 / JCM 1419 / IAM 19013 / LMG 5710 / NBRC 13948 / NRRL B-527 / VKM B-1787 / 2291 / W) TaxID=272562 RepID=Q97LT0_CLOAB|nr:MULTISPECIES: zinc ribbon domain-containing protein [Clostridium]AAK78454.1 ACT domain containing transcriptional regulators, related to gcvR of E.coli [Clostridium acetobutylicum ATCC 824]ADZ19524.1 ACT domain containing transcriptional regulator [Clostridium acetobutylicum EA 2018]AEI31262.1 transcriptional regulator [Clostridium acetobutylicum DSM 1731]AWV80176.1 transcriptional regulator [Clostridium acetobutylicum]MBC2392357.1 transcriptional regulator [Clostridium acetobutylicum]